MVHRPDESTLTEDFAIGWNTLILRHVHENFLRYDLDVFLKLKQDLGKKLGLS